MKNIIKLFVGIVIVLLIAIYVPQFIHTCTDCEKFFVGTGYEQNILVDALSAEDGILCKKCAEKHHVITVGLGKSLDDYRKPIEMNPITIIQGWIE